MSNIDKIYKCLWLGPLDKDHIRIFQTLAEKIHTSSINALRIDIYRIDSKLISFSVDQNIDEAIRNADLCIVDLSDLRPNVLVEYGVARSLKKPCILICEQNDNLNSELPSLLRGALVLSYSRNESGLVQLIDSLHAYFDVAIKEIENSQRSASPIVRYYPNRASANLPELILQAENQICILQTNLISFVNELIEPVVLALKKHASLGVRILTLSPDSPFAIYRSRQLQRDYTYYRNELVGSIVQTDDVLGEFSDQYEIRIYDDFPTQITYLIDSTIVWSIVTRNSRSRDNPAFMTTVSSKGAERGFAAHFDALWHVAHNFTRSVALRSSGVSLGDSPPPPSSTQSAAPREGSRRERVKVTSIPYYFGNCVSGEDDFFGRTEERSFIVRMIDDSTPEKSWHISIVGEYRSGKSSLLRRLELEIANKTATIPVYIDLSTVTEEYFAHSLISKVIEACSRRYHASAFTKIMNLIASKQFDALAKFDFDVDVIGIFKIKFDPSKYDHWVRVEKALKSIIAKTYQTTGNKGIVLILDEVNALKGWSNFREILVKMRSLPSECPGLNLLVGSPYPLDELTRDEWSPFFNIFYPISLGGLKDDEARELVTIPARRVNIEFSEAAVGRILRLCGNKPYYIQALCTKIFEGLMRMGIVDNPVRVESVDAAVPDTIVLLGAHFKHLFNKCSEMQQLLITALAREDYSSFNNILRKHQNNVELDLLIRRYLIINQSNKYCLTDLLLQYWITQTIYSE